MYDMGHQSRSGGTWCSTCAAGARWMPALHEHFSNQTVFADAESKPVDAWKGCARDVTWRRIRDVYGEHVEYVDFEFFAASAQADGKAGGGTSPSKQAALAAMRTSPTERAAWALLRRLGLHRVGEYERRDDHGFACSGQRSNAGRWQR